MNPKYKLTAQQAEMYYADIQSTVADQFISNWPGYIGELQCINNECYLNNDYGTIKFIIDFETYDVQVPGNNVTSRPNSVVYLNNDKIVESAYEDNTIGISIIITPEHKVIAADSLQANSMFTKLFYFNGTGLDCYKLFDKRQQVTGGMIYVWKIDWDCYSK